MDSLATVVLAEYKTKYPNSSLSIAKDTNAPRAAPTYEILLNGAGDRSKTISLRKDSLGIMLIITTGSCVMYLEPADENKAMALIRTHLPLA
jgi:hypothetical protein